MNKDTIILNKTLTNGIEKHIKKIVHYDWVDFIPEMQICFNICKSASVIQQTNK